MPGMSLHSRQEYLKEIKPRYLKATRLEKRAMLDEYCSNTKLNRKYVIFCLSPSTNLENKIKRQRKARSCTYTNNEIFYLKKIWEILDYPCGQRLKPMLSEMIAKLKQFKELIVPDEAAKKLSRISSTTIDVKLRTHKAHARRRFNTTTKPGSMLKSHIPIRTSSWEEKHPGYCELDTVAHCGDSAGGEFINTLNMTDILTQWTESAAVIGKAEKRIKDGLNEAKNRLPFTLKAIDPDNGSEFINWQMYHYCEEQKIEFTRGRPYKKNDNAHIEQKNWTHVRRVYGYERRETEAECDLMNDLNRNELRLYKNFFQSTLKLVDKKRVGRHHEKIKKVYDVAKTPYQRVLDCQEITEEKKDELRRIYQTLNPVALRKNILIKLNQLLKLTHERKRNQKDS